MGQQQVVISGTKWDQYKASLQKSKLSEVDPFYEQQLAFLGKIFESLDKKKVKSIELKDLDSIHFFREHPLYQRIILLMQQDMTKLKTKKNSLEIFLHFMEIFHINTKFDNKIRYLFRLYDWDCDLKLNTNDLVKTFEIMLRGPIYTEKVYMQLAREAIYRYGIKGQISFERFSTYIPQNEVLQVTTFNFMN